MFARSAAPDTLQGRAIHAINVKWGDDYLQRAGRESIGLPVCKKKYAPFCFPIGKNKEGKTEVQVKRLFGCKIHHELRKAVIEKHGERDGWEPFGQWSLQKAQELARQETLKMSKAKSAESSNSDAGETDPIDKDSSSDGSMSLSLGHTKTALMCMNGKCHWKVKSAYDDVFYELNGHTESEAEDNADS